jgi:hypothetical protein
MPFVITTLSQIQQAAVQAKYEVYEPSSPQGIFSIAFCLWTTWAEDSMCV